ncbi:MAG: polyprenyl synthetase family protein [Phycisphaerae bacterium]|nr:polyprenyl synthetase family protein [Phycisphaerae bacterium]
MTPAIADTRRSAILPDFYEPIAADLALAQQAFVDELRSDQPFINDLTAHIGQYHGKMLRPALVLLCGRAAGRVGERHHVAAAVVEMVHVATLVHDDILDEADTRRRVQTVNRLWGNERAVLLGDFLISHAFHLCSRIDSQHVSRRIGATTNAVCEGEMMQVVNRENYSLSENLYLEIIRRKTAALIGVSCELGGWCSDATPAVVGALHNFGERIGTAFQIVDDVLDLCGDEEIVGKSLGRDLAKGKPTLPLVHYLSTAPRAARESMLALLREAGEADNGHSAEIARRLQHHGSVAYAQDIATNMIQGAQECLAILPESPTRATLSAMADFVVSRRL